MIPVRTRHSVPALMLLAGLILVSACKVDERYEINPSDIDLSLTVLEDGLSVPIGNSDKISLGNLINSAGEGINDFISTGAGGELILSYDGSASLNDQLAELDLANMAVMDGVSFSEDFSYHIGDFNADDFNIQGRTLDMTVEFGGVDLVNVQPAAISSDGAGLSFHAGLDGFSDVLSGNENLDLSKQIGSITYEQVVLEKDELVGHMATFPDQFEVPVPQEYIPEINLPKGDIPINVASVQFEDGVTRLANIKTTPDAKLNVTLTMKNVFFTSGDMVPDVDLDFKDLLNIKDAVNGKINLKDMVLTKDNNWTLTKSFEIESLTKTDYTGSFGLKSSIPVEGNVNITNAKTKKAKVTQAAGDMELYIDVHFSDFKIASADMYVEMDPTEIPEKTVSLGGFAPTPLPKSISDVKRIILDETKPLTFTVTPKNIDSPCLKSKEFDYVFTFEFPSSVKVKDAVDGKLTFTGDLANGPVSHQIVLSEIYPTVANHCISLDADVKITAKVEPKNLIIDSSNIPQSPNEDLSFTVAIAGSPTISDYQLVIDSFNEKSDIHGSVEIDADGLESFSGVRVVPEGSPAMSIAFDIPTIKGMSITPGENGIKVSLPDFIVFNASAIDAAFNFNASDNSITLFNSFPKEVSLPIKELYIKPVTVDGKTKVIGNYSAVGSVVIPGTEISQADLEETFGTNMGLVVVIPDIKAESISLDDKLSFDVNQKFNMIVKNIPDQLKQINEILLDDVYVNLEAVFDGLPTSASSPFAVDITFTLPEFISPNIVPIKGNIVDGKLQATPVKLDKLYNIKPDEKGELKGDILIKGSISSDGADIDIAKLKSDISASITASIQNSNGKIAVSKASGEFSYDIEQETTLDLNNMPEMLKSDNICLDLSDPVLNLDISTNIGIPMTATLELVPFRNGAAVTENTVTLANVKLPYSSAATTTTKKSYSICKTASSAPAGREFIEADITKILKQLPDNIQIKIIAGVDPTVTAVLEPAATYTLDIDYGVKVPLAFGKDFRFFTETEIGLEDAAEIVAMGDFSISGDVLNESPLNLSVDMELLDEAGNVIPQAEKTSINIKGASTSPILVSLSTTDKSRVVSKARLTVNVTAIPDKPVKESDCLQFLNLVAKAKGVTVNPSK